jgi:GATA-binding protein
LYTISQQADPLPFAAEPDATMSPRTSKRRRMSTDSASEPPSSATSYSSYNEGYSSASSATSLSQRSSMEFPFSSYLGPNGTNGNGTVSSPFSTGPVLRGSGNTFWHPPMMPQGQGDMDSSPHVFHPPMLPPTHEDSPMDYLHPPMLAQDEENLFSSFLHPPMVVPDEQAGHIHPPMYPSEWSVGHESYDAPMRAY